MLLFPNLCAHSQFADDQCACNCIVHTLIIHNPKSTWWLGFHGKNLLMTMINKCQNTQCITKIYHNIKTTRVF